MRYLSRSLLPTAFAASTLVVVASLAAVASPAASDWPQWGGPTRQFRVEGVELADSWPEGGPKLLWERELGEGYAGVAAVAGSLYTLYRVGDEERVIAVDAANGKTLWEHPYPSPAAALTDQYGLGPDSTPLVVGGRVFTIGSLGELEALDAATGKKVWGRGLIKEIGGTFRGMSYSSSPIAWGDTVIAQVGEAGHALVAFRQADGAIAWQSGDFQSSSSSPILVRLGGKDLLVAFFLAEIAGFDPTDGKLLWTHPHKTTLGHNISTPVAGDDGVLFVSAAYDGGSAAVKLVAAEGGAVKVEPLWKSQKMRVHFTSMVRVGNLVVGSSGDFGPVPLAALDLTSGEIAWRDRAFSRANLLVVGQTAGERLLILDEDGTLGLATASPSGLTVLAQAQIGSDRNWTAPALVGNRLYVRDRKTLKAFELPLKK